MTTDNKPCGLPASNPDRPIKTRIFFTDDGPPPENLTTIARVIDGNTGKPIDLSDLTD